MAQHDFSATLAELARLHGLLANVHYYPESEYNIDFNSMSTKDRLFCYISLLVMVLHGIRTLKNWDTPYHTLQALCNAPSILEDYRILPDALPAVVDGLRTVWTSLEKDAR